MGSFEKRDRGMEATVSGSFFVLVNGGCRLWLYHAASRRVVTLLASLRELPHAHSLVLLLQILRPLLEPAAQQNMDEEVVVVCSHVAQARGEPSEPAVELLGGLRRRRKRQRTSRKSKQRAQTYLRVKRSSKGAFEGSAASFVRGRWRDFEIGRAHV